MRKVDLLAYVRRVARSIESNIERLEDEKAPGKLKKLAAGVRRFYVSLFDRRQGVFESDSIDDELTRGVQEESESPSQSTEKRQRPVAIARVGTGKGSPLKPRKVHVSNRQKRIRAQRGFDMSDFGTKNEKRARQQRVEQREQAETVGEQSTKGVESDDDETGETPPPPPSQTPPPQTVSPRSETELSSPTRTRTPTPPLQISHEDEGPLRLQVRKESRGRSGVQRFQLLAAMSQDGDTSSERSLDLQGNDVASDDELRLFAREIEHWHPVDARVEYALRDLWHEICRTVRGVPSDSAFLKTLVAVHNTSNAVSNSMAHLKGYLVELCHQRESSPREVELIRDEIEDGLREREYSEYTSLLTRCGCVECSGVCEFDDAYNRYRRRDEGTGEQPPRIDDRPAHCVSVDPSVRAVRAKYKGLSTSSLQKCHYFYLSTPKFSPPTLCTAVPTTVQVLTTAYMKRYARSFSIAESVPRTWYCNEPPPDTGDLVLELERQQVHLFDGDGGEILVKETSDQVLKDLRTHHEHIRFRLPKCDAPEIRTAFKFTRRRGEQTANVGTVNVGVNALRMARSILFKASEIHLLVRTREAGDGSVPAVEIDSPRYRRALCDLLLRTGEGDGLKPLSALLAEEGYMFPCFQYGVDRGVLSGMKTARSRDKGVFRLPEETWQPGFMPWDIKGGHNSSEPVPIRNVYGDHPEEVWLGRLSTRQLAVGSPTEYTFYAEVAESDEWLEGSCFAQTSTIPCAGRGLFLKPHPPIPKGQFVCLYATNATTEEAMDQNESSRDYAIQTGRARHWYDAEVEDGVCLGRFANQLHVLESLEEVCDLSRKSRYTEMREEDWKRVNDADAGRATVVYAERKEELILVTARDLPRAEEAHELFAHYGDLREYWLPLIRRKPRSFPDRMGNLVDWFLHSDECNWTEEQKGAWL